MPVAKLTIVERLSDGRLVSKRRDGSWRKVNDKTDWARVAAMTEEEIVANALSDPDNPPLTEAQLKNMRPFKRPITIRVDVDVLHWFRTRGVKYQTHMNAALRDYMNANAKKKRPRARS